MTLRTLVLRSLRYHWRAHLGVLLGATLSTAILVGALAVGDSVRYSLRGIALARLGDTHLVLHGQSRFFRAELAAGLASDLKAPVAPIMMLRGTAANDTSEARAGRVQILGVDERFWKLGPATHHSPLTTHQTQDGVILNDRLARTLGVRVGDEVLLRVDKPSLLSRDAPLSTIEDSSIALRLPVAAIVGDAGFGRFSLEANQVPPLNAFLPLGLLQHQVGLRGRANVLLVGGREGKPVAPPEATQALWGRWQFADSSLELRELPGRGALELRTDRVFLDPPVGDAALTMPGARGVLTYFVNELRVGDRATPYSTVSALQGPPIPPDMQDDEILINRWLADDLGARVGDELRLTYWVVGPMRRLKEVSSVFRIRAILPLKGAAADRDLMPPIPGLADKKNCREWEPGVPIDLDKIRDRDQDYWSAYRGTPKAFLTLRAGQRIWNNRFGNLTSVRYPLGVGRQAVGVTPPESPPSQGRARGGNAQRSTPSSRAVVEACIRQALSPASLGLFFAPVREQAFAASFEAMDFGQLFLGFSFFLIVAALLLTALLFAFGVEQRAEEVGTLLALGFPPRRVQRLLLMEGGALALAAGVVGAALAVFYTRAVIHGLSTVWQGAVARSSLQYHAEPMTLVVGAPAGFFVALLAIWLVTRKQARVPARELLAGESRGAGEYGSMGVETPTLRPRLSGLPTAIASVGIALVLVGVALAGHQETNAGLFFGAGALLLIGGIAASRALMGRLEYGSKNIHAPIRPHAHTPTRLTLTSLGMRNTTRRPSRSLSAIGLLACGSFLVIAVGANRHDPAEGAQQRSAGTGGFAFYGETTLPVYHDLNTEESREVFGLEADDLEGVEILPLRLREGDDASCLNLNRAQVPRLVGVNPQELARRNAFTFVGTSPPSLAGKGAGGLGNPWLLLERQGEDGAIPAIGDVNTVIWSLGKSLGATLDYVDERGNTRRLRIVGLLANSILQGSLVISESDFIQLFPSQSGYQVFLLDAPPEGAAEVSRTLTRALEDVGLALTPAAERLAAFNTVENTYLSIFAILGGLGLLLGSAGLGVVVLRNVLERRGELALLRAVGFRTRALHRLVFTEHALLLTLGLVVGVAAALVAVLPALRSPGADIPYLSLTLTLLAVFVSGFLWTWGATVLALRGPLLGALRNE